MLEIVLLTLLLGLAAAASLVSLRLGISVAVIELIGGIVVGNLFDLPWLDQAWLPFLAGLGAAILPFLAGAETDPGILKKEWRPLIRLGLLSFAAPFLAGTLAAFALGWSWPAALLTGVALSETSVAIVYMVMVPSGRSRTLLGRRVMAITFLTDIFASLALVALFVRPWWLIGLLAAGIAVAAVVGPPLFSRLFTMVARDRTEAEARILLVLIAVLALLAQFAGTVPAIPAYIAGLAFAPLLAKHKHSLLKLRTVALALPVPFFFLFAGLNVNAAVLYSGGLIIAILVIAKVGSKWLVMSIAGRPLFKQDTPFASLILSTGLTFGLLFAIAGLDGGQLNQDQFSLLVCAILLAAIVPAVMAEKIFPLGKSNSHA